MKKLSQKILGVITAFLMVFGLVTPVLNSAPVYADDEGAAILKGCWQEGQDSKNGAGIKCVVLLVVNIMSVLVGIVGIIGIVVVGIQYLTAGGNEEQTRKAKRRLFEIIIGIVAYVLMFALLNWLLPYFTPDTNETDKGSTPAKAELVITSTEA